MVGHSIDLDSDISEALVGAVEVPLVPHLLDALVVAAFVEVLDWALVGLAYSAAYVVDEIVLVAYLDSSFGADALALGDPQGVVA